MQQLSVEFQIRFAGRGLVDFEADRLRARGLFFRDQIDDAALFDETLGLGNRQNARIFQRLEYLRHFVGLGPGDEKELAIGSFLHAGKMLHLQFAPLDGLAFDDVNVRAEWVLAQNAQHERRIFAGECFLGPFGIFGKLEDDERFDLVRRKAGRLRCGPPHWRGGQAKSQGQPFEHFEKMEAPR